MTLIRYSDASSSPSALAVVTRLQFGTHCQKILSTSANVL